MDPDWGHVTIKMSEHPPFGAQIMLNGHEYVACQARQAGLPFARDGSCNGDPPIHVEDALARSIDDKPRPRPEPGGPGYWLHDRIPPRAGGTSPTRIGALRRATITSPGPASLPSASSITAPVSTRPSAASSSRARRASSAASTLVAASSTVCLPLRWFLLADHPHIHPLPGQVALIGFQHGLIGSHDGIPHRFGLARPVRCR